MSTPIWKVYSPDGEYIGAVRDSEDAAVLVSLRGDGGTVRFDHKLVVWREGREEISAGNSYDQAAAIMRERVAQRHEETRAWRVARQEAFARSQQP